MVQANDVHDLLHEQRIGGELETIGQMRLQLEPPPYPTDRRFRQPGPLGHR
jgi:hypothetical protein